jgi:hypothetical protein
VSDFVSTAETEEEAMRRIVVVALVASAMAVVVYGDRPGESAAAQTTVRAAQSLTISDLRVQRRAPGGRVHGSVAVGPAGTTLEVVVKRGGRHVGHRALTASAGARTSFSVRLDHPSPARLRRVGHLDLRVEVTASGPGSRVSAGTSARVTR